MKATRLAGALTLLTIGAGGALLSHGEFGYGLLSAGAVLFTVTLLPGERPLLGRHSRLFAALMALIVGGVGVAGIAGVVSVATPFAVALIAVSGGLALMATDMARMDHAADETKAHRL